MEMQPPQYVKTVCIEWISNDPKGGVAKPKVRFNPFYITSYSASTYTDNDKADKECVKTYIAGAIYFVDMTIEEFDKMMDEVERGLKWDESDM